MWSRTSQGSEQFHASLDRMEVPEGFKSRNPLWLADVFQVIKAGVWRASEISVHALE